MDKDRLDPSLVLQIDDPLTERQILKRGYSHEESNGVHPPYSNTQSESDFAPYRRERKNSWTNEQPTKVS